MTRREAIRNCFIVTVGTTLIPSCLRDNKPSIPLKHLDITGDQERLISELSETIIPKTDTPGAKDTYTHLFVLKMVDDCVNEDDQKKFVNGLKEFEKLAKKKYDKPFVECNQQQRNELVGSLVSQKDSKEDIAGFVKMVKRYTLQGYMTSQYYLTNVETYKLVPGKFHGCVPVKTLIHQAGTI